MRKIKVAVIFGGTNTEHEVSIVSAKSVINHLDPTKYEVLPIYITKQNQWGVLAPKNAALLPQTIETAIQPTDIKNDSIDVVFPVLHGPYGEDGTIQGLLEMLHLPYVGSNVIASAMCMDKVVQKQLCLQQGLPVVPFVWTDRHHWQNNPQPTLQYLSNKLHYPLFIKPANQGSSIGVTKVKRLDEVNTAINTALTYDDKVIIEQGIEKPREIECAVLGNHEPQTSVLGEIISSNEFYDYDAKYIDGQSQAIIPAKLPSVVTEKIQMYACKAFQVMNCSGLARIDFMVDATTLQIYLSELNTMPGFTSISMYPQLLAASGINYEQLLDRLIQLAIERHREQAKHQLSYQPKIEWQKK